MRFVDVKPNDVTAAMVYFRQCMAANTWSKDRALALLHLQRDPSALMDAIATEPEITGVE